VFQLSSQTFDPAVSRPVKAIREFCSGHSDNPELVREHDVVSVVSHIFRAVSDCTFCIVNPPNQNVRLEWAARMRRDGRDLLWTPQQRSVLLKNLCQRFRHTYEQMNMLLPQESADLDESDEEKSVIYVALRKLAPEQCLQYVAVPFAEMPQDGSVPGVTSTRERLGIIHRRHVGRLQGTQGVPQFGLKRVPCHRYYKVCIHGATAGCGAGKRCRIRHFLRVCFVQEGETKRQDASRAETNGSQTLVVSAFVSSRSPTLRNLAVVPR